MTLKGGRISFLQRQAPNRFPNPKWSVLNKCIYGQQVDSGRCVCVCTYTNSYRTRGHEFKKAE